MIRVVLKTGYIIFFIIFSIYVLLDTFVIEKLEKNVEKQKSSVVLPTEYISTDSYYEDENINIKLTTLTQYDTKIYVADIQISSIDYLKTAFANNIFGRNIKQETSDIASDNNAILAINGDFYGFRNYGLVLRNGVIYRETIKSSSNQEDLVIYNDGKFEIINESTANLEKILNNGAMQVFSFGPSLINCGNITVSANTEVAQAKASNPRTAVGIIDELHYIFVVSDGRTSESKGLSLYELATVMKNLECTVAYNLDGGGSSTMYFNGKVINNPTSGKSNSEREVSDIIYIGY